MMGGSFGALITKLLFLTALSSAALSALPRVASAHEVIPTIADMTAEDGVIAFDLRMNIEAFLAGIDLDGLADTNASEQSGRYDEFRGLDPGALEPLVRTFVQDWSLGVTTDSGATVALEYAGITIPEVGDPELPRASHLVLKGPLPPGTQTVTVAWPPGAGGLALRQQGVDEPFTGLLQGGQSTPPIDIGGGGMQTGWQAFSSYIPVGYDHILPRGLDHILFVLGLFFLSTQMRPLIWQISAFTLAHTVTLALGALGWVQVPPSIVEPLIAASITYVATENIFTRGLNPWRPAVVFCFGLLHGLGFASVLGEFGLPAGQFLPALIGFNIGVELGQLTVIALAFLAVGLWFGSKDWYRSRISVPASVCIALVGSFWFLQRAVL